MVEANAEAEQWCDEVNAKAHNAIAAVPAERLVVERMALRSRARSAAAERALLALCSSAGAFLLAAAAAGTARLASELAELCSLEAAFSRERMVASAFFTKSRHLRAGSRFSIPETLSKARGAPTAAALTDVHRQW